MSFVPPLGEESHRRGGPTLGWKTFAAVVLVTLPFGMLMLFGYVLWCKYMERKDKKDGLVQLVRRGAVDGDAPNGGGDPRGP